MMRQTLLRARTVWCVATIAIPFTVATSSEAYALELFKPPTQDSNGVPCSTGDIVPVVTGIAGTPASPLYLKQRTRSTWDPISGRIGSRVSYEPAEASFAVQIYTASLQHPVKAVLWEIKPKDGYTVDAGEIADKISQKVFSKPNYEYDVVFRQPSTYFVLVRVVDECLHSSMTGKPESKLQYQVVGEQSDEDECPANGIKGWLNRNDSENNNPPTPNLQFEATSRYEVSAYDQEYYPVPTAFRLDASLSKDADIPGQRHDSRYLCASWDISYTVNGETTTEHKTGMRVVANPMGNCWSDRSKYKDIWSVPPCSVVFKLTVSDGKNVATTNAVPVNDRPVGYSCAMNYVYDPGDEHPCV